MVKIFILLPLRTITYSFPVFMVKIVNKSVFISGFASKNISLSARFFMKPEYNREGKFKYLWIQLTYTLPKLWRDRILNYRGNLMYACIFDHHVIKKNDTAWRSWELENYVKYKFLRSTRNQLYSYNMKDISTTQILNGSQYNYYLVW